MSLLPTKRPKIESETHGLDISPPTIHEQASRVLIKRPGIVGNINAAIRLLREGNTIPFIARYRRTQTANVQEDDLRKIERELEIIDKVETKRKSTWKSAVKANADTAIINAIKLAYTTEELETLKESFSPHEGKKSKLQVAIEMGLAPLGAAIINDDIATIASAISRFNYLECSLDEVREGGIIIAAETIFQKYNQEELAKLARIVDLVSKLKTDKEQKYNAYHDFKRPLQSIKSYQYLAILRGEKEKALKVSFSCRYGNNPAVKSQTAEDDIDNMLDSILLKYQKGFNKSYNPMALPKSQEKQTAWKKARTRLRKMCERMWRRQLKEMAAEDAVVTFSGNLYQKLLTPPLRYWMSKKDESRFNYCEEEKRIIALDPGYAHGTKVAVVNASNGSVIDTCTLNMRKQEDAIVLLKSILWKDENRWEGMNSDVIAVGNGHGAQLAVNILKQAVGEKVGCINDIIYIDETGASIYSATELAKKELPEMDINHRSAVSLARRVIDPLAELCKIDPENLGVGQYQHDIDKSVLAIELRKCVESCVAKVGVDLTTCSESLLKYVPGIGPIKAKRVIEFREGKLGDKNERKRKKASLLSKKDLCNVQGIGEKVLKQAAGFVYISNAPKLVDRIAHIHPDTLPIIEFMQKHYGGENVPDLKLEDDLHVATITSFIENYRDGLTQNPVKMNAKGRKRALEDEKEVATSSKCDATEDTVADFYNIEIVKDVAKELQGLVEDVRKSNPKPLHIELDKKQKTIENVKKGDTFSGTVKNVVQFGAFVDINVGHDGLIHSSILRGLPIPLKVNQIIKVKVLDKELRGKRYRIALALA